MSTSARVLPADWSLPGCPLPPQWELDWAGLLERYRWLEPLKACQQNPEFHGEGDVLTHCRMVCEELSRLSEWRELTESVRGIIFATALLHDIGKPHCTVEEPDGKISSRGHTRRGAQITRGLLYKEGLAEAGPPPLAVRESIVALVRAHAKPMQFLRDEDSRHTVIETSMRVPCSCVALLAEADARGRTSSNCAAMLENVNLYREYATELGCLERPWQFPSDHSRFHYFSRRGGDPTREVFNDTTSEVILMSGLPGAGKDTWVERQATGLPVVSLDELRGELGVTPNEEQGAVAAQATELARGYLRKRQPFIWNATNISRRMREKLIRLFSDYGASTRIVYVETSYEELLRRNRQRSRQIPTTALEHLIEKWEVPDLTEAHHVDVVSANPKEQR